jgi:hypothetical protein
MDKAEKKKRKTDWRERERKIAFAALPLPISELRAMFQMLKVQLPKRGCDHTRCLAHSWLASGGHDVEKVFAWLDTQGGFCDCEILYNVPQHVAEAAKANQ